MPANKTFSLKNLLVVTLYSSYFLLAVTIAFADFSWFAFGRFMGALAAIMFCVTMLPGILRRLKVTGFLGKLGTKLMPNRAYLGSLMYVWAGIHWFILGLLPIITYGFNPPALFEVFGIIAFYLTLPLFLTSNLWIKKRMKKWWFRLHALAYIILWLIFTHVALVGFYYQSKVAYLVTAILLVTGLLQIFSLIKAKFFKPKVSSTPFSV